MITIIGTKDYDGTYEGELGQAAQARKEVRVATNEHIPHLVALFNQLDERGQRTTLAMLAVAVKLHPKKDKP